jgi:hypothetical protein
MKFWVDFEGFCKVEANSEQEATDRIEEIFNDVLKDVEISLLSAEKDEEEGD